VLFSRNIAIALPLINICGECFFVIYLEFGFGTIVANSLKR
jgi:hypothetical protein